MRFAKRLFLTLCVISAALLLYSQQPRIGGLCPLPYETPAYTKPPDDGVVFDSLLEAAGYGSGTNSDWVDLAAGNFCGGQERELVLLRTGTAIFPYCGVRRPIRWAAATWTRTPRIRGAR